MTFAELFAEVTRLLPKGRAFGLEVHRWSNEGDTRWSITDLSTGIRYWGYSAEHALADLRGKLIDKPTESTVAQLSKQIGDAQP